MKINKYIYTAHFLVLIAALLLYKNVVDLQFISSKYRVVQFSNYQIHQNCPEEFKGFSYCLKVGDDKPITLVLGDSSLLAFANSLGETHNVLSLGGGSCPMLEGISVSFSESTCIENSSRLTEIVEMSTLSNIETIYLMHRSEYLEQIGENQYVQAIRDTLQIFSEYNAEVFFILEPKRMSVQPGQCIDRLFPITRKNCNLWFPESYSKRKLILQNTFPMYKILEAKELDEVSPQKLINNYKDHNHITAKSFPCLYTSIAAKFDIKCVI